MNSSGSHAPLSAQQRSEDLPQRPICTFFAMGGCCKGARCPFSHELVQVAPKGVDVSGGYFISGKVANYKAAAPTAAAVSPSARSLGGPWDDPTASSSTDGLSALASPSSCCMTTVTSLSADAKEWAGTDSAAVSSSNSVTASINSAQSQQGAALPNTCSSTGWVHSVPATALRTTQPMPPLPMPHSQRGSQPQPQLFEAHLQAPKLQKSLQSPPPPQSQQGHKRQYQQPPQPRSVANARSVVFPKHSEGSVATEARYTSPAPAHPAAAPPTVSFMQSPNGSGATTIAALASFITRQRAATGHPSVTPSSSTLQPSKVIFERRPDDHAAATASSPAAAAPPRYTAVSTSTAAAAQYFHASPPPPSIATTIAPAPTHGSSRVARPSQHLEAPLPRSRESLAAGVEHEASSAAKAYVVQGACAPHTVVPTSPPHYEARTVSSAQTRVIPPAPRSQQQQAQQLRAQQEAQHQSQLQQQHQAEQQAQLQRVHQEIQPQKQEQQRTVYMLTSFPRSTSTPPQEGIVAPAQLSFRCTLPYAVPASTPTAPVSAPVLISEQPNATGPTFTLLSPCPPQSELQSVQPAKGTVLCGAPAQVLPQAAALSETEAPRLILVNTDGTFTVLQAAMLAATAGPGL
ncbi:hypothetical protein JIQ42_03633 [Leishmania sp. Namibia]|uniref:hypothetical protein n=1 Tax=Leishmania sp. Namibia TaxID=2802991 RepID=UPI001B658DE4|nr:hypothetical protein JIQ42_03633 [Leishmania sp. Namibia]